MAHLVWWFTFIKDGAFPVRKLLSFHMFFSHFQTHQTSIAPEQTTPEEWKCVSSLAKEFAPWTKGCQGSNTLGQSIKIYIYKDYIYISKSMGFLRYVHPTIHKIWISIMDDTLWHHIWRDEHPPTAGPMKDIYVDCCSTWVCREIGYNRFTSFYGRQIRGESFW